MGAIFAGRYISSGKGWLLVTGKETLADFYYNRGLHYFGGGAYNLATARANFTKALAANGGHYPFAHLELGRTYFVTGDFSRALDEVHAELSDYPDHNRAYYVEGLIYGFRKQYIQAEEAFKTFNANEVYPTWAGYNDLSWIYFAQGDFENAAETAWQGMQHTIQPPFAAWLENAYAIAKMNLGDYKTAEEYLMRAQRDFAAMTPEQWGISYSGNNPSDYESGLLQTRSAIEQNLTLVHSKLGGN